jgi:putative SOS response-associated peptidase YedK
LAELLHIHITEWTGPKDAKVPWRFTRADSDLFCFAGLWDRAETADGPVESFTIMTCAPGPDCQPYHNRQPVILDPEQWTSWLDLTADPTPLMRAGAANTVAIERAADRAVG